MPLRADEILDADRHAGERADVVAGHDPGLDRPGRLARQILGRRAERVQRRFKHLHALEHGVDDLDWGEILGANLASQSDRVHAADLAIGVVCGAHAHTSYRTCPITTCHASVLLLAPS